MPMTTATLRPNPSGTVSGDVGVMAQPRWKVEERENTYIPAHSNWHADHSGRNFPPESEAGEVEKYCSGLE